MIQILSYPEISVPVAARRNQFAQRRLLQRIDAIGALFPQTFGRVRARHRAAKPENSAEIGAARDQWRSSCDGA